MLFVNKAFEENNVQTSRMWSVIKGNRKSIQGIEWSYTKWMKIFSLFLPSLSPYFRKEMYMMFFSHCLLHCHFRKFWVEEVFVWLVFFIPTTLFWLLAFYLGSIWSFVWGFSYSDTLQGISGGKKTTFLFLFVYVTDVFRSLFKCCKLLLVKGWT